MKVRCRATKLSTQQRERIAGRLAERNVWPVALGDEYLVLGLTFSLRGTDLGTGVWVEYENPRQGEYVVFAPLDLFEVVEPTASATWEVRQDDDSITMWPTVFYRPGYHDRLSDGTPDEVEEFRRVKAQIASESRD